MRLTEEMTVSLYFSSCVKTGMFLDTTLSISVSPTACTELASEASMSRSLILWYFSSCVKTGMFLDTTLSISVSPTACARSAQLHDHHKVSGCC